MTRASLSNVPTQLDSAQEPGRVWPQGCQILDPGVVEPQVAAAGCTGLRYMETSLSRLWSVAQAVGLAARSPLFWHFLTLHFQPLMTL